MFETILGMKRDIGAAVGKHALGIEVLLHVVLIEITCESIHTVNIIKLTVIAHAAEEVEVVILLAALRH